MRIVGCALIAVAATLGLAPSALASAPDGTGPGTEAAAEPGTEAGAGAAGLAARDREAEPHAEVSLLAVSLTAGAAVAAVGSGAVQAVNRRRTPGRAHDQAPQDTVRP